MHRFSSLVTALCLLPFACGDEDNGTGAFGPGDTGDGGTGGDDGGQTSSGGTSGGSDDGNTGTGGGGSETDTGTGSSGTGSSGTGTDTSSSGTSTSSGGTTTGTSSGGTSSGGTTTGTSSGGTTTGTSSGGTTTGSSSGGTTTGTSGGGTTTGTSGGGTTTGGTTTGATTTGTTTGALDCSCVPDLDDGIFVVSDNSEMYKYFPDTNTFSSIGPFSCPGVSSSFSMAVDRKGTAWVMFRSTSDIFHVDLTQGGPLNCTDPGYSPNQMDGGHGPYGYYGMAFVSNSDVDPCEKLYGNTFDDTSFSEGPLGEGEFLVLDPQTLDVSYIGDTTFNGAELTGTGDGRAFMFGGVGPAKLVEVDKANGTYIDVLPLGNLDLTYAFAFAFFEGDFYFFTESGGIGTNSKVTHLDYDDTLALTDLPGTAPIRIVGAGVSTCVSPVPQ